MVEVKGSIGRWTAEAGGETLPVLHDTWWDGRAGYRDPMAKVKPHWKKYKEYVELLQTTNRAIIQRDKGDGDLSRRGYVGIFEIADLEIGESLEVSLHIGKKLIDLQ